MKPLLKELKDLIGIFMKVKKKANISASDQKVWEEYLKDPKDVLDSLKGEQDDMSASGAESAQSLIDSLREAKERLASISSAIGTNAPSAKDTTQQG